MLQALEDDLRLSAKVGQQLLADKGALEKRLTASEAGNQKLLDRLTSSVKEAAHLQRVSGPRRPTVLVGQTRERALSNHTYGRRG